MIYSRDHHLWPSNQNPGLVLFSTEKLVLLIGQTITSEAQVMGWYVYYLQCGMDFTKCKTLNGSTILQHWSVYYIYDV